ncbi:hypothetical protein DPMN_179597 [Dreissena polymorpha]|uniref:Uncharacterized protein n=1 Tax=Dreissena polymorpha TaxID=45954 RepID=A0A9D4IMB4_DREPO|nr:hypothetical protein DPMN_179597 [Dreissena polymorpha]
MTLLLIHSPAEDRLKRLTDELAMTENKLKQATKDLKGIGDNAMSEKEEQKQAIRQKMARKMRTVSTMYLVGMLND